MVNIDDFNFYFLTDAENFFGVLNTIPGELRHVYQTIGAIDVNEHAKICQAGDATGINSAFFEFFQDPFFNRFAGFSACLSF